MKRKPHIEERPWWPDALRRLRELEAAGETHWSAACIVGPEFGVARLTIRDAMERGSVSSFPSKSPARAAAWIAGEERYEGKPCVKHETRTRYTNDGRCIECMAEYDAVRRSRAKQTNIVRDAASLAAMGIV